MIDYVKTEDQLADVLTKVLGKIKFTELCLKIRVKKAWDEVRIQEENERGNSPLVGIIGSTSAIATQNGAPIMHALHWYYSTCERHPEQVDARMHSTVCLAGV